MQKHRLLMAGPIATMKILRDFPNYEVSMFDVFLRLKHMARGVRPGKRARTALRQSGEGGVRAAVPEQAGVMRAQVPELQSRSIAMIIPSKTDPQVFKDGRETSQEHNPDGAQEDIGDAEALARLLTYAAREAAALDLTDCHYFITLAASRLAEPPRTETGKTETGKTETGETALRQSRARLRTQIDIGVAALAVAARP
jgi:hypothetical protein